MSTRRFSSVTDDELVLARYKQASSSTRRVKRGVQGQIWSTGLTSCWLFTTLTLKPGLETDVAIISAKMDSKLAIKEAIAMGQETVLDEFVTYADSLIAGKYAKNLG
jgi:hypothetical protein